MSPIVIDAILFERDHEHWVAQCLQYDIGAQASSLQELIYQLHRSILGYAATCVENDVEPFSDLEPAPKEYWDDFKRAAITVADVEETPSFRLPRLMMVPQTRMRLAA